MAKQIRRAASAPSEVPYNPVLHHYEPGPEPTRFSPVGELIHRTRRGLTWEEWEAVKAMVEEFVR